MDMQVILDMFIMNVIGLPREDGDKLLFSWVGNSEHNEDRYSVDRVCHYRNCDIG